MALIFTVGMGSNVFALWSSADSVLALSGYVIWSLGCLIVGWFCCGLCPCLSLYVLFSLSAVLMDYWFCCGLDFLQSVCDLNSLLSWCTADSTYDLEPTLRVYGSLISFCYLMDCWILLPSLDSFRVYVICYFCYLIACWFCSGLKSTWDVCDPVPLLSDSLLTLLWPWLGSMWSSIFFCLKVCWFFDISGSMWSFPLFCIIVCLSYIYMKMY